MRTMAVAPACSMEFSSISTLKTVGRFVVNSLNCTPLSKLLSNDASTLYSVSDFRPVNRGNSTLVVLVNCGSGVVHASNDELMR